MDSWNKILHFSRPLFLGDPNIELLDRGQVLHLKTARRGDKGRYQCTVSNAAGKQTKDIRLTVHSKCASLCFLLASVLSMNWKAGFTVILTVLLLRLNNLECCFRISSLSLCVLG